MLTLNDGRSELWQWDTGRKLTVDAECTQVHFSNKVFGRSIDVDVVDGVAIVPDILLQTDKELTAWAFVGTAENGYTKISKVFKVNKRNKPADYVFTEQDQTTLGGILERIEDLENRPSADISKEDIQDAVNEYLDNNPVSLDEKDPTVPDWAKQPEPPKVKIPDTLPNPHKLTFSGAVQAEYDGSKEVTVEIPEGGSGGIPIQETAEVGQTVVVKAVDENGKPTAWAPVDLPEGGDTWRLVAYIKLTEDVQAIEITQDRDGNAFSLKKFRMIGTFRGNTGSTGAAYGFVRANTGRNHLMSCPGMAPAGGGRLCAAFLEFALRGQAAHVQFCSAPDNTSDVGIQCFVLGNVANDNIPGGRYAPVENLSITAANAGYGNGTAIELWGVDA